MFVLLFRYVFGGAIPMPGLAYVDYLMPGIFGQTVVFGATPPPSAWPRTWAAASSSGSARCPWPAWPCSAGRTVADLVRNAGVVVVMLVVGLAVGLPAPRRRARRRARRSLLVLAFAFALSWVMAAGRPEGGQRRGGPGRGVPAAVPADVRLGSAFVPVNSMPGWLQVFAAHQPVTVVVNAARGLMLGPGRRRRAAAGRRVHHLDHQLRAPEPGLDRGHPRRLRAPGRPPVQPS